MMRTLLLALLLTACGGGGPAPDDRAPATVQTPAIAVAGDPAAADTGPVAPVAPPVATTTPPSAPVPAVGDPAQPAGPSGPSGPVADTPQAAPVLWREEWAAPVMGGRVGQPIIDCAGGETDPQTGETWANMSAGDTWATFGAQSQALAGIVSATGGALVLDSAQAAHAGGWALLSAVRFDPAVSLLLEGTIELQPDAGAWISLPLIHGEGDYRQISLREDNGQITADLGAPCFYQVLGTYPPGPRRLALGWHPINGWTYSIDGVLLHTEPITHNRADLAGPVRVGLYVVNVGVEAGRLSSGVVRATVSPLRVMGNQ